MINAIKHIFFFVLIFAVGSAISQQNIAQLGNIGSSESGSKTLCQQLTNGSIANPSGDIDSLFKNVSKSNADDAQPKTITSCNSLLNILPTKNNFSFSPGEQPINIGFYNAVRSSLIFVFQEPDPPRLG
ncbi:hypothetical protein CK503_06405 [Aliifodinibius salipaludis]|uniref:Uncharacterized protein n=1 Tax=Fodinibius salipaludis TaxID=2032627 RepID=A0A2A2GC48_9BACT|nr:hypothetical protein [Aliifodinibius salipaludis]PAU94429.1 hypothetical protein CK503_06405 [Aliifodinibius salipaludis]